jgi:hypothetical protein
MNLEDEKWTIGSPRWSDAKPLVRGWRSKVSEIDPREFGRLEAEVKALTKCVEEMSADLKAVRSALDAAGGGWRVLVAVGGLSGAVTAVVVKWIPFFPLR